MKKNSEIIANIERASEIYSNNVTLRAIINLIPYVGSSLDILFTEKASRYTSQRINNLFESLNNELNKIREVLIDKDFLESEKWYDLIIQTLEKTVRTKSKEKINYFSKILVNSLTEVNARNNSDEFINILAELNEIEIHIAKLVFKYKKISIGKDSDRKKDSLNLFLNELSFIDKEDVEFYMKRLEKAGLVNEIVGSIVGYMGGYYEVTKTFEKLMKIISITNNN